MPENLPLCAELDIKFSQSVDKLKRFWNQLYVMNDNRTSRMTGEFKQLIEKYMDEIVAAEEQKVINAQKKIADLMTEKTTLEMELNERIKLDDNRNAAQPLTMKKEYLTNLVKEYSELKINRESTINNLMCEIEKLCANLGKDISLLISTPVLTEKYLKLIHSEYSNLKEEKQCRLETIKMVKSKILSLASELELPHDAFDDWNETVKSCLLTDEEDWPLTDECIDKFKETLLNLEITLDEEKSRKRELMTSLNQIWNLIGKEDSYKKNFILSNSRFGDSTFERINAEINTCKIFRKQNFMQFTESVRSHISALWEKMGYTPEKRAKFQAFYDDDITEEILQLNENYLSQINDHYNKYRDLYELIGERNNLKSVSDDLEKSAKDKSRLINRRCQLLKEEKERNHIHKKVSKINNAILQKANVYMKAEGEPFTWQGQHITDFLKSEQVMLGQLKDQLKSPKLRTVEDNLSSEQAAETPTRPCISKSSASTACLGLKPEVLRAHTAHFPDTAQPSDTAHPPDTAQSPNGSPIPEVVVISPDDSSIIVISP